MDLVAGLDLGTTSAKLVVLDSDGVVVARAEAPYETRMAAGGVAEQDPMDWWLAACAVIAESGVGGRISALGLTGQMQDLVAVRDGVPTRPAVLYSDTRASAETTELHGRLPGWESITGNHQDASNVAAKILHVSRGEPEALDGARILLGAPGFVGARATGVAACDVVTASTTGLLDVASGQWSEEVRTAIDLGAGSLPRLVGVAEGDDVLGPLDEGAATELGLRAAIPVVHAMGDAGATTDGLVGSDPGDAYLYLGTSGWLAAVVPASEAPPSAIHSLVMPGWVNRLRIAAVQSAGATADWSRRTLFAGLDFADVEELLVPRLQAVSARPLCLPGLAGERTPVRDESFRGAFVGVDAATTREDLHLAALTGVAMALRHGADEMGLRQDRIGLVGGAAASSAWRQVLADCFGATIVTGDSDEPAAHSAARAAARTVGLDVPPLLAGTRDVVETPPSAAAELCQAQLPTHRALYDALRPTFAQLHAARH